MPFIPLILDTDSYYVDIADQMGQEYADAMSGKGAGTADAPRSRTLWIPRPLQALAWVMRVVPRPVWRHMPR